MQKEKRLFFALLCLMLLTTGHAYSQTNTKIKSLIISDIKYSNSFGTITIQTNEFTDTLEKQGSSGMPAIFGCDPCRAGETMSTLFYSINGLTFGKSLGDNRFRYYKFSDTVMSSPPITVPYFYPQNRPMTFRKPAQIKGHLDIYEENTGTGDKQLLYTAEFDMAGSASLKFSSLWRLLPPLEKYKYAFFNEAAFSYLS
ncbi:MAG: hypothetical protein M3033_18735 [Acidobacteriota bacterium]|nr:hypothetical protein [Acidobacteriota bacterium]